MKTIVFSLLFSLWGSSLFAFDSDNYDVQCEGLNQPALFAYETLGNFTSFMHDSLTCGNQLGAFQTGYYMRFESEDDVIKRYADVLVLAAFEGTDIRNLVYMEVEEEDPLMVLGGALDSDTFTLVDESIVDLDGQVCEDAGSHEECDVILANITINGIPFKKYNIFELSEVEAFFSVKLSGAITLEYPQSSGGDDWKVSSSASMNLGAGATVSVLASLISGSLDGSIKVLSGGYDLNIQGLNPNGVTYVASPNIKAFSSASLELKLSAFGFLSKTYPLFEIGNDIFKKSYTKLRTVSASDYYSLSTPPSTRRLLLSSNETENTESDDTSEDSLDLVVNDVNYDMGILSSIVLTLLNSDES